MITKIQGTKSNSSSPMGNLLNAVDYSERKMTGDESILDESREKEYSENENTGHIVATVNVPSESSLENEFYRLKMKNLKVSGGRKLQNITFHMSINPDTKDNPMSEKDIVEFTDELMTGLGYGDTPYRIYRHDDTGRTHYHVVGIRIGEDGKKINDSFENKRCEQITRSLALKYGFIYGNDLSSNEVVTRIKESENKGQENPKKTELEGKEKKTFVPPYKKNSNLIDKQQYAAFHKELMKWSFTTPEQYAFVMKYRYNTDVEMYDENELLFTGLDSKGEDITTPMSEHEIGIPAMKEMLQKCADTNMRQRRSQRERLEKNIDETAYEAESWKDFKKGLLEKGIITVISWTKEGEPFGITYLDKQTRCAWKGSETSKGLDFIRQTASAKGWTIEPSRIESKDTRQRHKEAKPNKTKSYLPSGGSSMNSLFSRHAVTPSKLNNVSAAKNKERLKKENEEPEIIV